MELVVAFDVVVAMMEVDLTSGSQKKKWRFPRRKKMDSGHGFTVAFGHTFVVALPQ